MAAGVRPERRVEPAQPHQRDRSMEDVEVARRSATVNEHLHQSAGAGPREPAHYGLEELGRRLVGVTRGCAYSRGTQRREPRQRTEHGRTAQPPELDAVTIAQTAQPAVPLPSA